MSCLFDLPLYWLCSFFFCYVYFLALGWLQRHNFLLYFCNLLIPYWAVNCCLVAINHKWFIPEPQRIQNAFRSSATASVLQSSANTLKFVTNLLMDWFYFCVSKKLILNIGGIFIMQVMWSSIALTVIVCIWLPCCIHKIKMCCTFPVLWALSHVILWLFFVKWAWLQTLQLT